jgi:hypothetical protein
MQPPSSGQSLTPATWRKLEFMNFQELDDLKLFADEVMPAFA